MSKDDKLKPVKITDAEYDQKAEQAILMGSIKLNALLDPAQVVCQRALREIKDSKKHAACMEVFANTHEALNKLIHEHDDLLVAHSQ